MKLYWLIIILLLASCAPAITIPPQKSKQPPTASQIATGTIIPLTPVAKPTNAPTAPARPQWMLLAKAMQEKAQRAIVEKLWEDTQFKEEGYQICKKMIRISTGKISKDSAEVLKRFRWGMEMMDVGQLQEVIKILDQYN